MFAKLAKWFSDETNRNLLYKLVAIIAPVLFTYGVITQDIVGLIMQIASVLLGVGASGLAIANTKSKKDNTDV